MKNPRSAKEAQSWMEIAVETAASIEEKNPVWAEKILARALRWEKQANDPNKHGNA